ncbi:MAG: hypothetical protein HY928_01505 [Elusimicrobia bacterium]|nr:hypothetical protein [Elusimicrobiota bacterium]
MPFLRLLPAILCCLVLGAHFLRGGHPLLAAGLAAFPFALALRAPWVKRAFEGVLVAAILVWLSTAARLAASRLEAGEPWVRMACILGGVAAFNGLALWLLRGERMRAFFNVQS